MNINKKLNDDSLIISLEGRLDTNTSPELEKELGDLNNINSVVFDFENLEYISSAGLRLILKIKKQNHAVEIINCNAEVYDIFSMTGFVEIVDVSKALRKVSVDGCEIIGQGFYGTIYQIDQETIVKVYKKGYSIDLIKREIDLARKALVLGIPTAIPYDIVKVGDLYGSVFELINSKSVQKLIIEGQNIEIIVKDLVDVLKKIHNTEIKDNDLPSKKTEIIEMGSKCKEYLPKETGEKLMKLIFNIPMVDTMVHGDFHIKNIMKQNDEIILIDMDKIAVGHPIFELGAMYATYRAFACVDKNNTQDFLGIPFEQSEKILQLIFQYYFNDKTSEYIEEVMYKASIIAYLEVMWLRLTFMDENNELQKQEIEFCKNYLTQNLPKIDSLDF